MSTKTYTVKVSKDAPNFSAEQIAGWLDEQIASNAALAPDPGSGEKSLRLTLERAKVEQAAKAAGETESAVFLRRLLGARGNLKPEERKEEAPAEQKPRPKEAVLPPRLRLNADQLAPVVAAYDHLQAFAISRAMRAPEAMSAARFTPEEREQLAGATAELANRRAPEWLVQNIDVVGFASLLLSIEFKKIDAAREVAKRTRARAQRPAETETPNPEVIDVIPS